MNTMTEPEPTERRLFDSECHRCGELVDWLELWSERDKKYFFAPATPGTFQLHVNVCNKNPKRPTVAWQNPQAVERGHDAILRKQIEHLKHEVTVIQRANSEPMGLLAAKDKMGKLSNNLKTVGHGQREDFLIENIDLDFAAIGDSDKKRKILAAWLAGYDETAIIKNFQITPTQLYVLVSFAKAYNMRPKQGAVAPAAPEGEFNDHPIFGQLRKYDDGVKIGQMVEALKEWKKKGGSCGDIARRHGFSVDIMSQYFDAQRSDSCTHFGPRVKKHTPDCFTV